jgi:hypothetical protein
MTGGARKRLIAVIAFAVGLGVGGVVGLAANAGSGDHRTNARPPTTPTTTLPPRHVVIPDTVLAWTPGGLPDGFAERVASLPGVARVVPVLSGTAWLTRSYASDGTLVDHPSGGLSIPIEVAGANLGAYSPFLSPADRAFLPGVSKGEGLLGTTSAKIRRLGTGGVLQFSADRVRIAGVVPDTAIGAQEVFVSARTAAALGITRERYLLVDPKDGAGDGLVAKIRSLLPQGEPLRVRGPGETPYFRQGDAVLAPVILKEDFGEFAARPISGGNLQMDPRWEATHIVAANVPILGRVRCNRAIIPQLRGALDDLQSRGLSQLIDVSQYAGCYSARFALHDPSASISHHTWGIAVDLNVGQNPFGHTPHQDPRLVTIFENWGFIWGGRFLVPDGMHFEFIRFASGG